MACQIKSDNPEKTIKIFPNREINNEKLEAEDEIVVFLFIKNPLTTISDIKMT